MSETSDRYAYVALQGRSLLSKEQEAELGRAIQDGYAAADRLADEGLSESERKHLCELAEKGRRARDDFVAANLRLVLSVVRRYRFRWAGRVDEDDVLQMGAIGLIRAVEKFDWTKGFKFSTYATWWIKQAIEQSLAAEGAIRLPPKAHRVLGCLRVFENDFVAQHRRAPTFDEILEGTGFARSMLSGVLGRPEVTSMDQAIDDSGTPLSDTVGAGDDDLDEVVDSIARAQAVNVALSMLNDFERSIVILSFGLDGRGARAIPRIASEMGVTVNSATMARRAALARLRRAGKNGRLAAA
jgi:RNA polymerase primary sigma factor